MEVSTIFLGIIAISSVIIALSFLAIAIAVVKLTKNVNDKASILTYEAANVLRGLRDTVLNVEQVSRVFNIFSFLKKGKANESK
ncbi:MAG: hypothetical protein RL154_1138 [Pseudomonadota bacterium]|jgi:uncharacterized protein YoxC